MANGFYQAGMRHFAQGDIVWKAAGGSDIRTCLVDSADYTVDLVNHEYRNATGLAAGIEETMGSGMTLVDAANDGVCDASDVTFVATSGDTCEGILIYKNVGSAATDLLLFWWDAASGLPVVLGGDVTVSWDNGSNKIARI
jgi:hypothetical protein